MPRAQMRCASAVFVLTVGAVLGASVWPEIGRAWAARTSVTVPYVPSKVPVLFDTRPVDITITAFWQKVARTVTVDQLLTDHTLWRQMHFGDWDKVTNPLRDRALGSMLAHYGSALAGPGVWVGLSVFDWDQIPQPIRAFAYQRMIAHWTSHYDVGSGYADNPQLVAQTVSAIVMAESWFEHRALAVNQWDNRDLGLAGCSNHCRRILGEMAAEGRVDFLLEDHEYYDPWNGTRVAAIWFGRELVLADGDMDVAIAAYYRGHAAASRGEGAEYAANVKRLRRQYIAAEDAPPAWAFLASQIRGAYAFAAPGASRGPSPGAD